MLTTLSSYLEQPIRPLPHAIADMIRCREVALSRVNDPAERRRIERELVFLREEFGRLP